jgi:hypothetical protein
MVQLKPEDVAPRFRWLVELVNPYMPLCLVAFTRAGSHVEFGDILASPRGYTSREALTAIIGKRARMVAMSGAPPILFERDWEYYRDDPRITRDARIGAWLVRCGAGIPGFPKIDGAPDGWELGKDVDDDPRMDPLEVRYQRECEALARTDPQSPWMAEFIRLNVCASVGGSVSLRDMAPIITRYRQSLVDTKNPRIAYAAVGEFAKFTMLYALHGVGRIVDIVSWTAVRSGRAADIVEGAKLAAGLVMAASWPADEDHASFVRRCRELGDPIYNGKWRDWFTYDEEVFPNRLEEELKVWKETKERLAELGLAYG